MRTIVALENSNCTRCHNAMLAALREREGVRRVWSDFSTGCLVIEHEDDPDALVSLITTADRAVAVAANGERVMVAPCGHEAAECRTSKGTVDTRGADRMTATSATSATNAAESDAPGPASPPPSGASSSKTIASKGLSAHSGTGEGPGPARVRVLSRERPAPGLTLRALRFIVRTFRTVFRLPSVPR